MGTFLCEGEADGKTVSYILRLLYIVQSYAIHSITATPLFCWLMALIVSACGGVGKKWWFINHLFNHSSQFSGGIEQPVNNIIIVWINL